MPKRVLLSVLALVLALGLIWLWTRWVANWAYHPLGVCTPSPNCKGYQLWSGIMGCFVSLSLFTGLAAMARHLNCDHKGCWRFGHRHPDHGRPMCDLHYNHTPHGLQKYHDLPAEWHKARNHHFFQSLRVAGAPTE